MCGWVGGGGGVGVGCGCGCVCVCVCVRACVRARVCVCVVSRYILQEVIIYKVSLFSKIFSLSEIGFLPCVNNYKQNTKG